MTKGVDVAKMKVAFKRAADKALHGTREERSGRFMPAKTRISASPNRGLKQSGSKRRKVGST
jgi:hypothetical protein